MTEVKHWTLRTLQVLLWLLALDAALGSLLLLFGGRSLFVTLFRYPASEVTDLLLLKQKEWGGLGVALTLMLVAAARNPLTSLIVVRALATGVAVAGIADVASIWLLDAGRLYPVAVLAAHGMVRIVTAALLGYLTWRIDGVAPDKR
jgi:hypothetical protein